MKFTQTCSCSKFVSCALFLSVKVKGQQRQVQMNWLANCPVFCIHVLTNIYQDYNVSLLGLENISKTIQDIYS